MIRKINCRKYNKELPGLDQPPYPGPKGQEIYETISEKAWKEWLNHQKMLINESRLDLADKESRKWLNDQMDLFLSGKEYAQPKGFSPPKE